MFFFLQKVKTLLLFEIFWFFFHMVNIMSAQPQQRAHMTGDKYAHSVPSKANICVWVCENIHMLLFKLLCVIAWARHSWSLAQHYIGISKLTETSWDAGHSALDFTLVLFIGAAQIMLHNTLHLRYSGYGSPYSELPAGSSHAQGAILTGGLVSETKLCLHQWTS